MTTIVRLPLENTPSGTDRWVAVATAVSRWAQSENIELRDACVLLPFVQLLPDARRAFAKAGGWMPRIETTKTLSAALGPAAPAQPGQITLDPTTDALIASALLRSKSWGAAWARRDPHGFEQASRAFVLTAHALVRAAASVSPAQRPDYWMRAQETLAPTPGPGATERLLAWEALAWASQTPAPPTDRLFAVASVSAWVAVQAGGGDAVIDRLMADARVPCLLIDADALDAAAGDPIERGASTCLPAFAVCDSFEHEAQCAAAQVLAHVQQDEVPVALIAQDRVLVRRVRALLERYRLHLLDETGWKLSTTRAAAQVMAFLRAARSDASTNALLDWFKSGATWAARAGDRDAVSSLEAVCRRESIARVSQLHSADLDPAATRLWSSASQTLDRFAAARRQPLPMWLASLSSALQECAVLDALQADDAGQQVIKALRIPNAASSANAWSTVAGQAVMDLDEFREWADVVLEQATFLPAVAFDEPAQVVITPMAQAMLRPFAAIVLPGADDKRLGAAPASNALLSDAQSLSLGVPTSAQRREAELLAFAQMLAAPRITFMRRRADGADPLSDSPLIERLSLALSVSGRLMREWHDPRIEVRLAPTPIHMTAPSAASLLPARLSASACEALRACPYRFFALNMLRLREDDELERDIEKRDYGTWLHAVLLAFHTERDAPASSEVEVAKLKTLAMQSQGSRNIGDADFLPFSASFETFAPRYIAWLHDRDRKGARWLSGEDEVDLLPAELEGVELHGIIDRVDEVRLDGAGAIELIDYKTGSAESLKAKVKEPLEDTQLAFYAALMRSRTELPLRAGYLALDGTKCIKEISHPDVEVSAAVLVEGLAHDLRRLRTGAGLPALGEGSTCDYCAARGICRRDHWSEDVSISDPPSGQTT